MRSAAVITAATASLAVAGMGSAFAGQPCPPKEQLNASASCEDAGGVVIRIANSSQQDVNFMLTSPDHQESHTGTAWGVHKKHQKVRTTEVDLHHQASKGDVWKISYANGARSDWVKIRDTCPAPKHSTPPKTPPSTPPVVHTNPKVEPVSVAAPALAHTGAGNAPIVAGGAAALLVAGAGTVLFTRRVRRNH